MAYCRKCKSRSHYQDRERKNATQREYYKRRSAYYRETDLRDKHGITLAQYEELHQSQNGLCAICNNPENVRHGSDKPIRLSVDHDYQTGKIRGLLCTRCNPGLGFFRDNPALLELAAQYLRKHS